MQILLQQNSSLRSLAGVACFLNRNKPGASPGTTHCCNASHGLGHGHGHGVMRHIMVRPNDFQMHMAQSDNIAAGQGRAVLGHW